MLAFKINEIQKGKSSEVIDLADDYFDLTGLKYRDLKLTVNFEKREFTIQVDFSFTAEVELTCDRSLEVFWQEIDGQYAVLYKDGADFESEDAQMSVRRLDISGNIINIEGEVRDTVLLSVPVRKIHPRYFDENGELTELKLTSDTPKTIDPRWEKLESLKNTIKNN